MSFFHSLNVSASGLTAQRLRMDTISENIANATTTRTADGGPYQRKTALFEERTDGRYTSFDSLFQSVVSKVSEGNGVKVSRLVNDESPGRLEYEPEHPDANEDGYVEYPNVNVVEEMVNMISSSRSYEANVTAFNNTKAMINKTLEIGSR